MDFRHRTSDNFLSYSTACCLRESNSRHYRKVYTLRVTRLSSGELLQPLEDKLRQSFLPALTGQPAPNDALREFLALPCRLGGMGIPNPVTMLVIQFDTSFKICQPLLDIICGKIENILAQS